MPPNGQWDNNNQNSQQEPVFTPPQNFEPPQTPGMFQVQPQPENKTKKILIAVVIGAGVLALITAVLLYVFLVIMKPAPEEEEKKIPNLTAKIVITEVKALAFNNFPDEEVKEGEAATKPALVVTDEKLSPAYQSEGYQYFTQYESEAAFSYTVTVPAPAAVQAEEATVPSESATILLSDIVERAYKEKGLASITGATPQTTADGATATTILVAGRGIVCEVAAINTQLLQKGTIRCGEQTEYTKTAALFQPLVDGITNVAPASTFRTLTEVDSDAGGYKRATLQVIEDTVVSTVYFYKKDAGRWHHLATSKEEKLACSVFSDVDKQRAYLNTPCADAANANATVKIIEKKR